MHQLYVISTVDAAVRVSWCLACKGAWQTLSICCYDQGIPVLAALDKNDIWTDEEAQCSNWDDDIDDGREVPE